ncbi:fibrinogen-related protein, partial [Mytilus galloprovincialis]
MRLHDNGYPTSKKIGNNCNSKVDITFELFCSCTGVAQVRGKMKYAMDIQRGVCFYGKTAERVLSILSTGKYRSLLPSEPKVRDCSDLDPKHYKSGVYKIYPVGGAGFKAYCDMETDGGGWTVFQRRQDGKVDFYRGWEEYENGFGNLKSEFWLGNDKLYKLTSRGQYELRVNLEDFNGDKAYAKYSNFYIGDKSTNYKLTANGYSGTAAI